MGIYNLLKFQVPIYFSLGEESDTKMSLTLDLPNLNKKLNIHLSKSVKITISASEAARDLSLGAKWPQ